MNEAGAVIPFRAVALLKPRRGVHVCECECCFFVHLSSTPSTTTPHHTHQQAQSPKRELMHGQAAGIFSASSFFVPLSFSGPFFVFPPKLRRKCLVLPICAAQRRGRKIICACTQEKGLSTGVEATRFAFANFGGFVCVVVCFFAFLSPSFLLLLLRPHAHTLPYCCCHTHSHTLFFLSLSV